MFKLFALAAIAASAGSAHAVTSPIATFERDGQTAGDGWKAGAFTAHTASRPMTPIAALTVGARAHAALKTSRSIAGVASPVATVSKLPEPAHWGMMILGFGLIGLAMRRRGGAPAAD